jgi:molybdate transport system substrate-binding protein
MDRNEVKSLFLSAAAAAMLIAPSVPANATTTINVAVAANFANPLNDLISAFKAAYPSASYDVTTTGTSYSSGQLESQITGTCATTPTCTTTNPNAFGKYDLFLSADVSHPLDLYNNHPTLVTQWTTTATTGSLYYLFNYADGFLDLWDNTSTTVAPGVTSGLPTGWTQVAIANPTSAPYGLAGEQVLSNVYGITLPNSKVISTYSDITAAYDAVSTGAVYYGFVARSQICISQGGVTTYSGTSHQDIAPGSGTYNQIIQDGVIIANTTAHTRNSAQQTELDRFVAFITNFTTSPPSSAVQTLQKYCYGVP